MNRFLCGTVFIITLCCMESCSLQRFIPFRKKKSTSATPNSLDTTASGSQQPATFALYPQPDTTPNIVVHDTMGVTRQLIEELTPVFNKRKQYTTFSAKVKIHFEGPGEQQDITAFIRMKKDSVIWVNIFGLGGVVNAARVYITPDSLIMINYLQREVTKISLNQVARVLPVKVDFASLQYLITGEPLGNGIIKDVAVLTGSWLLKVEDSSYNQNIGYSKKDSTITMNEVDTHDPTGPQAMLKYEAYETINDRLLSRLRKINIKNGADLYSIEMYLQNADFDRQLDMPFNIPENYSVK